MTRYDYLIVGGGIAGTTAAETIRARDPKSTIAIANDYPYRLFSRIMLSKPAHFLGLVPPEMIWLRSEEWYREQQIDLLLGQKAIGLDPKAKKVVFADKSELGYEKLLLAVGACARPWQVPGADREGVFSLRTFDDGKGIMAAAKTAKRAVLVGGGFISFELSDLLCKSGLEVEVVIREARYWEYMLSAGQSAIIDRALEKNGVPVHYGAEVAEVLGTNRVEAVRLADGGQIACDLVVAGIGVICPTEWLKPSGLAMNRGIVANEFLETNLPQVWTAGDIAEYHDLVLDENVIMANWANAQGQGQRVGANMADEHEPYQAVTTYTSHAFDVAIGFVGDARPAEDREVIARGAADKHSLAQLIIKDNKIIGASLVNRQAEMGCLKKIIESKIDIGSIISKLPDDQFDLTKLLTQPATKSTCPKIRLAWFSFTCCEDNTVMFTELLNEHWREWKEIFDFRHVRVLKRENKFDEFDIAFIEGAITTEDQEKRLREIRERTETLVAVGSCAVVGMPAGQRNQFNQEQQDEIDFLLTRFHELPRVLKVAEVVKVDAQVSGCPMAPADFLAVVEKYVADFRAKHHA